jgi:hypothetical protein
MQFLDLSLMSGFVTPHLPCKYVCKPFNSLLLPLANLTGRTLIAVIKGKLELFDQSQEMDHQKKELDDQGRMLSALASKLDKIEAEVKMLKSKDMTAQK